MLAFLFCYRSCHCYYCYVLVFISASRWHWLTSTKRRTRHSLCTSHYGKVPGVHRIFPLQEPLTTLVGGSKEQGLDQILDSWLVITYNSSMVCIIVLIENPVSDTIILHYTSLIWWVHDRLQHQLLLSFDLPLQTLMMSPPPLFRSVTLMSSTVSKRLGSKVTSPSPFPGWWSI